ncbi:MAG: APC family permease [Planctomycetota bacterium]
MSGKSPTESTSDRRLGTVSLTALVVASMVGAGVFTTSGFALADLQDPAWVMAAWAVGGLIATCGAYSYGQLASRLTANGGEYLFLSRSVHPSAGFLAGWVSMLAGFTGAGAYAALAFETYVLSAMPGESGLPSGTIGVGLVLFATAAHAFHTQGGAWGQTAVVLVKLLLLGAFLAWSWVNAGRWSSMPELMPAASVSWFAFATTVMWISLSYSGFNAAIYVAGEAAEGHAGVRRAMVGGTIAITVLYLLLNTVFLFGADSGAIAGQPTVATIAAEAIGGPSMSMLVTIAICIGLASSVSSIVMAGPRVYAKMAQDGLLPAALHSPKSPPTFAVVLQGMAVAIVVWFSQLESLLSYLGLSLSLSAAATASTLLLRSGSGDDAVPHWATRVPVVLYVVATLFISALTLYHKPVQAIALVITVLSGLMLYLVVRTRARMTA